MNATKTHWFALVMFTAIALLAQVALARELSVEDFTFDGPSGSQGAAIERVAANHFKVILGHAPEHPTWCNMLQFQILRNAKRNRLRLDVYFYGGDTYRFNHYAHSSWSYDGINWQPIKWQKEAKESSKGDRLLFPEFEEDTVYFGHQVPMSYENLVEMMKKWSEHPHAKVHVLGKSLEGRNIYRLEITNPQSPYARNRRWVHYFGNQHPGEHNAQRRMVGMIEKGNVASGAVLMKSLAQYYQGTNEAATTEQAPTSLHEAAKTGRIARLEEKVAALEARLHKERHEFNKMGENNYQVFQVDTEERSIFNNVRIDGDVNNDGFNCTVQGCKD